jgi:hypothetical protein
VTTTGRRARLSGAVLTVVGVLAAGCSSSGGDPFHISASAAASSSASASSSALQHFPPETSTSAGSSSVPSASAGSSGAPTYSCPKVDYQLAHLSFDCIDTGLSFSTDKPIWPLIGTKEVEPTTHWSFEEGADDYGDLGSMTLADIPKGARTRMVDLGEYGLKPTVTTVADKATTVAGQSAHLLQTTITLNPTYRASIKTKVKQEKLWIIAIQNGNDVVLWYTSLPDLVSNLWARVPATIASIKITG